MEIRERLFEHLSGNPTEKRGRYTAAINIKGGADEKKRRMLASSGCTNWLPRDYEAGALRTERQEGFRHVVDDI